MAAAGALGGMDDGAASLESYPEKDDWGEEDRDDEGEDAKDQHGRFFFGEDGAGHFVCQLINFIWHEDGDDGADASEEDAECWPPKNKGE